MSPWKSRWSWLRFVKTSTAKRTRSSRWRTDACDEASIAHERSPASSISRNRRCRSIASGVVRTTPRRSPPTRASTVPSRPGRRPAAARIANRRKLVVVFPLVPVTPTTSSSRVGSPKNTSAAGAIAARASRTTICGTARSSARSTTSATAPRSDRLRARSRGRRHACPARRRRACPDRPRGRRRRDRAPRPMGARAPPPARALRRGAPGPSRPRVSTRAGSGYLIRRSGGTSRYWRSKDAICSNAGAATRPP